MPDNQSRTTRAVLIAGLLGGLLGGVVSFAAGRVIKPAPPPPPEPPRSEAREVADAFVAKLRAGKIDEFTQDVKQGITFMSEQEFAKFKVDLAESRSVIPGVFGPATGEFELIRETTLSPSLVRLFYLEGRSYEEISTQLNIPVNSVGAILSRARKKLRGEV